MIYPAIVLVVLFAIMIFMTTTVLPQVANIYKSLPNPSLPFVTVLLLKFSSFITNFWWALILILIGAVYFLRKYIKTSSGRSVVDGLKMRTPPVGPLFMKLYMARFARTASTLI